MIRTGQFELCAVPQTGPVRRVTLTASVPRWLSPVVAAEVAAHIAAGNGPVSFHFSRGERKIMRHRKPVPVSQWAEKYRIVEMSSIPGKWKNLFTPYLTGIMDAAGTPGVETVIICKSPQTGGSECGHNFVGWCIDRSPGPVMYVFPDEITARENAKDRIIPMIEASPRLREYMTGYGDDASSLRVNLTHMPIYLAWSGSVSRLGNKPIRTLVLDELDKYKNPKNEATSEVLAEKRTTTWRSRRHIIKISTPTTEDGPIWTALTREAGARFDYWVRCPHCGMAQLMDFERIDWPDKGTEMEPTAEEVLTRRLACYPCEHCGAVWDDSDRAVRRGEWRERSSGLDLAAHLAARKPVKIGFHIPAWLSYFVSLSEVASAALKYRESGKLDDLKNLQNQYKAEPWREEHVVRSEDSILALCDDRPRGAAPGPVEGKERVACLLAGVDTQGVNEQKGYFRYIIRAFGYGDTEESWLIQCGAAPSFSALNEILWNSEYTTPDGLKYKVRACMIDAMGGRTREVYSWAIRHRGRVYPWQGVRSLSQPYTPAPQEYFPDARGNKVKIPGGLNLWRCDTTFFKSDLAHKLSIAPDDPGAFHLHDNAGGILEQYARELCAEVWDDEKQAWVNPHGKPNHYWDCETMALALAFILNIRHRQRPEPAPRTTPKTSMERRRGGLSIADRLAHIRR
ncbi:terminase gpA endonuclease subunit [Desulfovibrio sp. ZJ369]|uniref:terminase gpA endonuclease subunit n=1 Tax=Desulfovibrio sp. ZJ369 TaxID=2709793 RepID=UPI0013EDB198|nr:terminase gpA endonuclease subunit [Desulfovibrio sp. ZJ369]